MKKALLLVVSVFITINITQAQDITNKLGGNTANETYDVTDSADNVLFRVQGDGKIGVGNDTPSEALDVDGNIKVSGTVDGIDIATDVTANTAKVTDDDDGVAEVYGAGWDGDTDSPTKNDVYDKIEALPVEHDAVTIGTANGLSLSTQQISLSTATTSAAGAISSSDKTKLNKIASTSTTASGSYSTAMGYQTEASGSASTAMGYQTEASGAYSTAMGYQTEASGNYSTAMGQQTTAIGAASTAMGYVTTASEQYSTAMGLYTTASGSRSTAMGLNTSASGYESTAMGYSTTASGDYSTAMGREIQSSGDYTVAIALNDQNGTNVTQANTMAIMGGNVGIGTITPGAKLSIVGLLEYADNAAALLGGLIAGDLYRTGDLLKIVH